MSTKDFCDECNKEIKDKGVRIADFRKSFIVSHFCPDCFKKHWQGPLPESKE